MVGVPLACVTPAMRKTLRAAFERLLFFYGMTVRMV